MAAAARREGAQTPAFCTLFDRNYLAHGLVLYRSLLEHCEGFSLRVYCMDEETERALRALALPGVQPVALSELERADPELLAVKPTRGLVEYYWTATPSVCLHALEHEPELELITYLDADIAFYADPQPLFEELGDGSVLLTEHRSAHSFGSWVEELTGRFNVVFESFRRDADGLGALRWWRERCLEWCYERFEPERYADQKYLDQLPARFGGVRVINHPGAGLAPWNVARYRVTRGANDELCADGTPVIFHHYQSVELHPATPAARRLAARTNAYRLTPGPEPLVWTTGWRLSERELTVLWDPYVASLSQALSDLREALGPGLLPRFSAPRPQRVGFHLLRRRLPPVARDIYWRTRRRRAYARAASG